MKHLIKQIMLTVQIAFVSLSASAYDFMVDGIYYNVVSAGDLTCEVSFNGTGPYTGTGTYSGNVVIPSTVAYDGRQLTVIRIGDYAFTGCTELRSVKIPNSVTSIGKSAFECCSLTAIDIPSSVTSIERLAFYGSDLISVEIPKSVISLDNLAPYNYGSTFENCKNLESVTILNSEITGGEFEGCSSLISVNMSNDVKSIGGFAFSGCTKLESIKSPNSVVKIEISVFSESGIEELVIGKGIKEFPVSSNSKYYFLTEADSLKKIVIVDSNDTLTVPRGHTSREEIIDFENLSALNELYIGRNIHSSSSNRSSINNENLKRIEYGDSCTATLDVSKCTSLKEIVFGKGISSITYNDVSQDSLTAIYVKAITPPSVGNIFSHNTYMNVKLYVPKESLTAYKSANVWKDFWNIAGIDYTSSISKHIVDNNDKPDVIYDLNGHRLSSPRSGLNIINGKKVFIK